MNVSHVRQIKADITISLFGLVIPHVFVLFVFKEAVERLDVYGSDPSS